MAIFNIKSQSSSNVNTASWDTGNDRDHLQINNNRFSVSNEICDLKYSLDETCNNKNSKTFYVQHSVINTSDRSYINSNSASLKPNNYAILMRSQLLSKNMREGKFNFYTGSFDFGSISYITKYFYVEQKISSIFYVNFFSLPKQSLELSEILSLYDPISQDLTKQYSFVVSPDFLGENAEENLNVIANEYANKFNGKILDVLVPIQAFAIDFSKNSIEDAISFSQNDTRIQNNFQNGHVQKAKWTGRYKNKPSKCFNLNYQCFDSDDKWPRTLCPFKTDGNRYYKKTVNEIISELPSCWSNPTRKAKEVYDWLRSASRICHFQSKPSFVYTQLSRLCTGDLPLDRSYPGRTKPRNKLKSQGGTCNELKDPVYAYIVDEPIGNINISHNQFEGRLNTFYGPIRVIDFYGYFKHGVQVASVLAGADCGVTRKPELVSVGVLAGGWGSYKTVAKGISRVIQDKINYPDRKMIINLSLGGITTAEDNIMEHAIREAINLGIIVVVAAGNNNLDARLITPARMGEVITVGATVIVGQCGQSISSIGCFQATAQGVGNPGNFMDMKTRFSNFGPAVDIYATGQFVIAANPNTIRLRHRKTRVSGTSFSCPLAAGVTAETVRHMENLPNDQTAQEIVKNIIIGHSHGGDNGVAGQWGYQTNYGIINLYPYRDDNNRILQNPYQNCEGDDVINDFDDESDCEPNIPNNLIIEEQPKLNDQGDAIQINAKYVYGTASSIKTVNVPDIGMAWQSRPSLSENFETFAYGASIPIDLVPINAIQIRLLISYPGVTGIGWDINNNSLSSNIVDWPINVEPPQLTQTEDGYF
jgi:hypothetical protein